MPGQTCSRNHRKVETTRCCRWRDQPVKSTEVLSERSCRLSESLHTSETNAATDPFNEAKPRRHSSYTSDMAHATSLIGSWNSTNAIAAPLIVVLVLFDQALFQFLLSGHGVLPRYSVAEDGRILRFRRDLKSAH